VSWLSVTNFFATRRIGISRQNPSTPTSIKIVRHRCRYINNNILRSIFDFCDTRIVTVNANPAGGKEIVDQGSTTERSALIEKWGSALKAGFQIIPSVLIRAQSKLHLDAVDCMILLNLNLHWWQKNDLPYPPPALIANRMGVSRRTIERRLFRLQKAGWVQRLPADGKDGQPKIRKYDLSGMVQRLQEAAIIGVNQREYHKRTASKRTSQRKLPSASRKPLLLRSGI
jgi:hypothetical protein